MSTQFLKIYFVPEAFSGWCWCFWFLIPHFENHWLRAWALHWQTCVLIYHLLAVIFSGKLCNSCWEIHWESSWGFPIMWQVTFSLLLSGFLLVCGFWQFEYNASWCDARTLFYLEFTEHLLLVWLCLPSDLGHFQPLLLQIISRCLSFSLCLFRIP